jgi:flagellar biosynthesis/type III secretory pathway M-ring protein FliF/YscJ
MSNKVMSSEALTLLIIWAVAVVAFFMLWALLAKVIKRISEKKSQAKDAMQEESDRKESSGESET